MSLKALRFFVMICAILFSCPPLFAKPTKLKKSNPVQVLELKKFQQLSREKKITYLKALQEFVIRADFSKDPRAKVSWLEAFINISHAVDEQSPCIFAGFLMNMKQAKSGRWYCPKPPRGECPIAHVECNPLVFGKTPKQETICVGEPFHDATEQCMRASDKSLNSVANLLDSNSESYDAELAQGWENFRNGVQEYCLSPFPFNSDNCNTLREQFRFIDEKISPTYTKPAEGTR